MSRLTDHQVHEYRKVFNKFVESEKGRLTLNSLYHLLLLFGPELPIAEVKRLLYRHDWHCEGTLDFEDFLELLSEYEETMWKEQEVGKQALSHFVAQAEKSGLSRETFVQILQAGKTGLSEAEVNQVMALYFPAQHTLSTGELLDKFSDASLKWVPEKAPPPEYDHGALRVIEIHVSKAYNLERFVRTKIRLGRGVEYSTIDPLLSVSLGEETQETMALIGHRSPEWRQDIELLVEIPDMEEADLLLWIETQRIVFNMYDYVLDGVVPHLEWLASGSLPLGPVLLSTTPVHVVLTMRSQLLPPFSDPVRVELSLRVDRDQLLERMAPLDDAVISKYQDKIRLDLGLGLEGQRAPSPLNLGILGTSSTPASRPALESPLPAGDTGEGVKTAASLDVVVDGKDVEDGDEAGASVPAERLPVADIPLWEHFFKFFTEYRTAFRRRPFAVLGLDEYSHFRILCCFVRPFDPPARLVQPSEIAAKVAALARPNALPSLPQSQSLLHAASPSTMLFKDSLTPLELSILLCNHFLGVGIDAYVCIGSYVGQRSAWVVVVHAATETGADILDASHAALRPKSRIENVPTIQADGDPSASKDGDDGDGDDKEEHKSDVSALVPPPRSPVPRPESKAESIDARSPLMLKRGGTSSSFHSTGTTTEAILATTQAEESKDDDYLDNVTFESDRFSKQGERKRMFETRVTFWDPISGTAMPLSEGSVPSGYERVWTMFNDRNVWLNTQQTDLVARARWNLRDKNDWTVFLTPEAMASCGPVDCWYQETSLEDTNLNLVRGPRGVPTNAEMVHLLAEQIQSYRRHYLFIPETRLHRPTSAVLQAKIALADNVQALDLAVIDMVPDHTVWHSRLVHIGTCDPSEIMQQLAWTGVLDCSVPEAVYALAVQVKTNLWGRPEVKISVGYLINLWGSRVR